MSKEEPLPPSLWKRIWNILSDIVGWVSVVIIIASIIYMVCRLIKVTHERALIKDDPGRTEAIITRIANPTKGGYAVYYEYEVDGVHYRDFDRPGNKTVKTLHTGQTIPIDYQQSNPANSKMTHSKLFESDD